tara:strand:+ start:114 stop:593 length:480 start_codon:yes stop_codon:yes gene_type:complete
MNKFLSEFIYGSIDGLITTFAIISSSIGASIPNVYIIIISIASLLSDGYSMGISRYLSYTAELKKNVQSKNPLISGIYTFISFVIIGILPILPFIFLKDNIFQTSLVITLVLFLLIGIIKGLILDSSIIRNAIETLLLGGSAALISYYVGYYLKNQLNL